jgi:hypothetical protein
MRLSFPYLLNKGCLLTPIFISKSPFMLPFPLILSIISSWTPCGIVIYSVVFVETIPEPEHDWQGEEILTPYPPQL